MSENFLKLLPDSPVGKKGWPWETADIYSSFGNQDKLALPKISIITPSYNQGEFLEETIRSVLIQGYPNLEYIIIDGGSRDNSVEIIKKYEPWLTYWVSEKDNGQSHAINKGWKRATGDIIAYINSDDIYEPKIFKKIAKFFHDNKNIDMIYGKAGVINKESKLFGWCRVEVFNLARLLFNNIIPQPTVFFRKKILESVGYLDEELYMTMDLDMWIRIGLKLKICYIPDVLSYSRIYDYNKTALYEEKDLSERLLIANKIFSFKNIPIELQKKRKQIYSYHYNNLGVFYYCSGELKKAREYLLRSVLSYPLNIFLRQTFSTIIKTFLGKKVLSVFKKYKEFVL